MPGWIVIEPPTKGALSEDGRSVVFTARVRRWHPGLWIFIARTMIAERFAR